MAEKKLRSAMKVRVKKSEADKKAAKQKPSEVKADADK